MYFVLSLSPFCLRYGKLDGSREQRYVTQLSMP